jgi:hypothetical protein
MIVRALCAMLLLAVQAPAPQLRPVTSLAGEWRVAGIDGQPVEGAVGLALSGNAREIWWEPRCALMIQGYRIRGGRFSALPPPSFSPSRGGPPPIICTIAPPAQMAGVFRALQAGTKVRRTENNGVEISGGGHSLLLFSQ